MAHLTVLEALSGVFGSVSLASWVFVLVLLPSTHSPLQEARSVRLTLPQVPQLLENYRSKSADGISLAFLLVWFVGDVTNLIGAVWAGLVPTVIALALYFCVADAVLISQCLYYKHLNSRNKRRAAASTRASEGDPHQPLLESDDREIESGSIRRSSTTHRRRTSSFKDGSLPVLVDNGGPGSSWTWNTISLLVVCFAGAAGWAIAWKARLWTPTPRSDDDGANRGPVGAMALGYLSAICYLG